MRCRGESRARGTSKASKAALLALLVQRSASQQQTKRRRMRCRGESRARGTSKASKAALLALLVQRESELGVLVKLVKQRY
jgi:Leu/Phe-tRNA-protein transferase